MHDENEYDAPQDKPDMKAPFGKYGEAFENMGPLSG
jgi:hypothetical protein